MTKPVTSVAIMMLADAEFGVDPVKKIGAVHMMQLLPFYDESAIRALRGFEATVYRQLK